ncbi:MAG: hypothetical protein JNL39_09790 [Opitutaceae bacterium]|nr:hypothetical protein [Opitutaceae bacterium]
MKNKLVPAFTAACALLLGATAGAQSYHAYELTPPVTTAAKLNGAARGKQVGGLLHSTGYTHAMLLTGNALSAVDLHPALGFYYSMATATDETQQGGWGYATTGGIHALVWSGTAASVVDLQPSGYNFSFCLGVHGGEQVGYAQSQSYFVTASHAHLWRGSSNSAVNLHPGTLTYSRALGVRNGEQVGYASSVAYPDGESLGYHTTSRAFKWNGSAASAVDLHPAGFDASEATSTNGTQQGGWGYIALGTSHQHALLWSGSAASVVDLHPAGYTDSRINALNATVQVGEGWVGTPGALGSVRHALVWSGTAGSVIDLNQCLPAGYTHAVATGVSDDGKIVGYAYNNYVTGLGIPTGAIAVVWAPGTAPAAGLASLTLTPSPVAPGDTVQATATLGAAAPAGGVTLAFLSSSLALLPAPAGLVIPEGSTSASVPITTGGLTLTTPTTAKLYATDGTVSRSASVSLVPVVKLAGLTVNPVEGGFTTTGTVSLNIPAQAGGAVISLSSGNPALATVPATVTVPQGYLSIGFSIATSGVTTSTTVPITATRNGQSVTANLAISAAPVVSLASLTIPSVIGGQSVVGTVTLNNFARELTGAVVTLTSGDTNTLQVPASVTIPRGAYTTTFNVTTNIVSGTKGVSVKAVYNGANLTTTVMVNPIPPVTIVSADYYRDTQMFKVVATTTETNPVLTFGTDPNSAPVGTMQYEVGQWKGSTILAGPVPTIATVWSASGGVSSMPVRVRDTQGGGGGGGGGSTGVDSLGNFKLAISTNGKGTVSSSPAGTTYAPGTVVTLTATVGSGGVWKGWTGDVVSPSKTITVTVTKDTKVTANFR